MIAKTTETAAARGEFAYYCSDCSWPDEFYLSKDDEPGAAWTIHDHSNPVADNDPRNTLAIVRKVRELRRLDNVAGGNSKAARCCVSEPGRVSMKGRPMVHEPDGPTHTRYATGLNKCIRLADDLPAGSVIRLVKHRGHLRLVTITPDHPAHPEHPEHRTRD